MIFFKNILNRIYKKGTYLKYGFELNKNLSEIILEYLNNPHYNEQFVHITGTNGKGSSCTKISSCLEQIGYRVGLFTSPHISSFRERMRVNQLNILEQDICHVLPKVLDVIDNNNLSLSFFEQMTSLAFLYFSQKRIDWTILEVGLGGKLDATNVITPKLSIITSIGMDHIRLIGDSIEKITSEKCGVIKYNVPVLIGPRVPTNISKKISNNQKAPLFRIKGTFQNFLQENFEISRKAIEILNIFYYVPFPVLDDVELALTKNPLCRLEFLKAKLENNRTIEYVLDVAHNPDGLDIFFKTLRKKRPNNKFRVCFGISIDKSISSSCIILNKFSNIIHPIKASDIFRACSLVKYKNKFSKRKFKNLDEKYNVMNTINKALNELNTSEELLVVCGSVFIMKEARRALGIIESVDFWDLKSFLADTKK